jgi:hypothetical protein
MEAPRPRPAPERRFDPAARPPSPEERAGLWVQLALVLALEAAFLAAGGTLFKYLPALTIEPWQKVAFQAGLALAFLVFGLRALRIWRRLHDAPPRDS